MNTTSTVLTLTLIERSQNLRKRRGKNPKRMKCNKGGSKKEEKEMTRKYKGKNRI